MWVGQGPYKDCRATDDDGGDVDDDDYNLQLKETRQIT
jgi:hypothetical protein